MEDPFLIDGSGLEVKQDGLLWEKEQVQVQTAKTNRANNEINVINNSPDSFQYKFTLKPLFLVSDAERFTSAKGRNHQNDELVKIDNKLAKEMTLNKIHLILKTDVSKKIHLEVKRNGIPMKFEFTLEDQSLILRNDFSNDIIEN